MRKDDLVHSVLFSRPSLFEPFQLVSLVAVGDICLGGRLREKLLPKGGESAFEFCRDIFRDNDILFGNVEMVIADVPFSACVRNNDMLVPVSTARCIVAEGFNVMNVANNHILDCGHSAAQQTVGFLSRNDILYCGYGGNVDAAWAPTILQKKGQSVAFIGISDNWNQGARKQAPGVAICDQNRAVQAVRDLRQRVDHVVISYHADLEFSDYPDPDRIRFSRRLIRNGATLVLQHHPHVPQGIEVFSSRLIAYSLGNFVFDVEGDDYLKYGSEFCRISFALRVLLDNVGVVKATIFPIVLDEIGRPCLPDKEKGKSVIQHIQNISKGIADENLLWRNWFMVSRKYLIKETGLLKYLFHQGGLPAVFNRLIQLVRITENRRWLKGLLIYIFHRCSTHRSSV